MNINDIPLDKLGNILKESLEEYMYGEPYIKDAIPSSDDNTVEFYHEGKLNMCSVAGIFRDKVNKLERLSKP